MKNEFLFSNKGKDLLIEKYEKSELSIREVAELCNSYPMEIMRALKHHNLTIRTKSEAQKKAIQKGKSKPPIQRNRTEEERIAISNGVRKAWKNGKYDKEMYSKRGKENSNKLDSKVGLNALKNGNSKKLPFKKTIIQTIKDNFSDVKFNETLYLDKKMVKPDVWILPEMIAIIIVCPKHSSKMFGELPRYIKNKRISEIESAVLASGGTLINISYFKKTLSNAAIRELCQTLIETIKIIKINPLPIGSRKINMEI